MNDTDTGFYTPSEKPNNTAQTTRALIRWNHWIEATTPVQLTGDGDLRQPGGIV